MLNGAIRGDESNVCRLEEAQTPDSLKCLYACTSIRLYFILAEIFRIEVLEVFRPLFSFFALIEGFAGFLAGS